MDQFERLLGKTKIRVYFEMLIGTRMGKDKYL